MIAVFGAGSIGCYVGGMLAAAGEDITLIGRPALEKALAGGLQVSAMGASPIRTMTGVTSDPAILSEARMVLVCVKSADTAEAAQIIKDNTQNAPVISLQNGISNVTTLQEILGPKRVVAGMVGFNVVRVAPDHFGQKTEGEIILDPAGASLRDLLAKTPIKAKCHDNMAGVQWSKLLMNLNNALNALSGLPLKTQLEDRAWRKLFADCVAEGLAVAKADGIKLERIGKVHPKRLPSLLRLPNFIFLRIAQSMMKIDPEARSSMADDYTLGRAPEVAWLNGYIVDRGKVHGLQTPGNARVCAMIKAAFTNKARPPLRHQPTAVHA